MRNQTLEKLLYEHIVLTAWHLQLARWPKTTLNARLLMFSHMNLLSPTIENPISLPTWILGQIELSL